MKMLKYLFIVWSMVLLCSCNQTKNTEEITLDDPCIGAKQDKTIVELLENNKSRIEPGFTGVLSGKYPNDSSKTQFLIYFYKGDLYTYESFYLNGNLKLLKPIRCNSANGLLEYYYPDGTLNYTLEMYMGRKHGEGISYYPGGIVNKIKYFTYDTLDGYQYEFFENGDTALVEKFEMGTKITLP